MVRAGDGNLWEGAVTDWDDGSLPLGGKGWIWPGLDGEVQERINHNAMPLSRHDVRGDTEARPAVA